MLYLRRYLGSSFLGSSFLGSSFLGSRSVRVSFSSSSVFLQSSNTTGNLTPEERLRKRLQYRRRVDPSILKKQQQAAAESLPGKDDHENDGKDKDKDNNDDGKDDDEEESSVNGRRVIISNEPVRIDQARTSFDIRTMAGRDASRLKRRSEPWNEDVAKGIITVATRRYITPDSPMSHPDSRKVVLSLRLQDLKLEPDEARKLKLLSGRRYNSITDVLKLTSVRYATREQNHLYLMNVLHDLIQEARDKTQMFETLPDPRPTRPPRSAEKTYPFPKEWIHGQKVHFRILADMEGGGGEREGALPEEGDIVAMDFDEWKSRYRDGEDEELMVFSPRAGAYVSVPRRNLSKLKRGYTTVKTLVSKTTSESQSELLFQRHETLLVQEGDMINADGQNQTVIAQNLKSKMGHVAVAHIRWTALDGQIWRAVKPNEAIGGGSLALSDGAIVRSSAKYELDEEGCLLAQHRGKVGRVNLSCLKKIRLEKDWSSAGPTVTPPSPQLEAAAVADSNA